MELEEEVAERALMSWSLHGCEPFPVSPGVPAVPYRWDVTDRWDGPWVGADRDVVSVHEVRTRVLSVLSGTGWVLTLSQFEVVAALYDEWDGELSALVEVARLTVSDPDGPLFP